MSAANDWPSTEDVIKTMVRLTEVLKPKGNPPSESPLLDKQHLADMLAACTMVKMWCDRLTDEEYKSVANTVALLAKIAEAGMASVAHLVDHPRPFDSELN